jgi:choline-sulfatase
VTGCLPSRINAFDNGSPLPANIPTFVHARRLAEHEKVLSDKAHFTRPDTHHG